MEPMLILQGDGGTFLGADDIEHILSRLLGVLGEEDELAPATGQYSGYDVRCSLILLEVHHVLYAADWHGERLLLWQSSDDAALPIMGTIKLSPQQQHQWAAQIKQIKPNLWPSFQGSSYLAQKPA